MNLLRLFVLFSFLFFADLNFTLCLHKCSTKILAGARVFKYLARMNERWNAFLRAFVKERKQEWRRIIFLFCSTGWMRARERNAVQCRLYSVDCLGMYRFPFHALSINLVVAFKLQPSPVILSRLGWCLDMDKSKGARAGPRASKEEGNRQKCHENEERARGGEGMKQNLAIKLPL